MNNNNNSRILVIGDIHAPFEHSKTLEFLTCIKKEYKPTRVIFIGDEIENNAINFHSNGTNPELFTASKELELAIEHLKPLYKLFPKADILESNHTSLFYRRQKYHGLPRSVFKEYREILDAPKGWLWHFELVLKTKQGPILFHHGYSKNTLLVSKSKGMNYVAGHYHSNMSIQYWVSGERKRFFAMQVGCLIDFNSLAFSYAKNTIAYPALGCAMIIDGVPRLIPL